MLGILALIFQFIPSLLGGNLVEKVLASKREQLASANEAEKIRLDADIRFWEQENVRRKTISELQAKEYEHPLLWWPKFLVMMAVAFYWFAVFMHVTLGLSDFGIVIGNLTPMQEGVSSMVLAYMFLDGSVKRIMRK